MLDLPLVIKDIELRGAGAWANSFLGRDHHAKAEHFAGQKEGGR